MYRTKDRYNYVVENFFFSKRRIKRIKKYRWKRKKEERKLGVARTDVTRVVGMFLVSVSVTNEIPRFANMWKPRFHENNSGKRDFLEAIGRIFRPRNCSSVASKRPPIITKRSTVPISSCHPRHRNENTNVYICKPCSNIVILLDASFPPISTELISRVDLLAVIREIGSIQRSLSPLTRGRGRETCLIIFRDTVLPSRNWRIFLQRWNVFDEDSEKNMKKREMK